MRFPRLHEYEPEEIPPVYRFEEFSQQDGSGDARKLHDAELAVERVQKCLDRLDELLEPLPFRRFETEDDGPWAA
ncbi:MAG: hypothetical protein D6695_12105 [Planctomycetota bacterium]|nr:MAG: hypothetical protein D6695_12105 [Planctomycetota bacterium]